jgi:hypothetical protein
MKKPQASTSAMSGPTSASDGMRSANEREWPAGAEGVDMMDDLDT